MRLIAFILLVMWSAHASGQISYSYNDPCTGAKKTIQVPANGITVAYYGQVQTFQPTDFYNGGFENWAQGVFSSFGANNPCASVVGVPTAVNVAQSSAINFLGTINSLSALSDMASIGGGSNMLGGTIQSTQSSTSSSGGKKGSKSNNNQSTGGSQSGSQTGSSQGTGTSGSSTTNQSSTSQTASGGQGSGTTGGAEGSQPATTTGGGQGSGTTGGSEGSQPTTTTGGGQGSQGTGSGQEGTQSQSTQESPTTEEGGQTNLVGSSVNSVQSSTGSSPTNKNGNRPTMLASSDFVGFQFQNADVATGGKFTGGFASMRWDGARSWGINADYTTALRGPNITGYYAFIKPKRIDLISVTGTIGFEERLTAYGTLSVGQMWTINKLNKMKAVYMLTASWGQVYGESFVGTAAITGGMYDFKVTKRFDFKVLLLYVYAPYVSYYNDILLESPHVVLPIVGTNINLTKRFKLNVNCGGAWAVKDAALNYTVMFGTRMLL